MEIPLNTLRPHDPRCSVFNTCGNRLYHYTLLQTVALILESQAIRFNRLDRVNDPRECVSADYQAAQTLVFASCWTDAADESIPHWKMYSGLAGVRVELPTLMFNGRHNNHKVTKDDRLYELTMDERGDGLAFCQIERRGERVYFSSSSYVMGPMRIRYVDGDVQPMKNVHIANPAAKYDLRALGTEKHFSWQFEREVRFRILALGGYGSDGHGHFMSPDAVLASPVVTEFVDVPLDKAVLDEIEIVLGPKATRADYLLLRSLCKEYAPSAKIRQSTIQMR